VNPTALALFLTAPVPDALRPLVEFAGVPIDGVAKEAVGEAHLAALLAPIRSVHSSLTVVPANDDTTAVHVEASASSHATWRDKVYSPGNVLDRDHRTAWVEGDRGHGIGQKLLLRLTPVGDMVPRLQGLVILPGYAKNRGMWRRNGRPRSLNLATGPHRWTLSLDDARRPQIFLLPENVPVTKPTVVSLSIAAVYAGSHYRDTSIAEVRLLFW
jgi:hypothetical protein